MTVEERLERLERSNKRWWIATSVIAAVVVLDIAIQWATRGEYNSITTGEITVHDRRLGDVWKREVKITPGRITVLGSTPKELEYWEPDSPYSHMPRRQNSN